MTPVHDAIRFSSRPGMLLTMIGLAVGLGNVWRFPYMMGSYGGSAFLLVYLGFTLLLAVPALSAEWALGWGLGRARATAALFGETAPGWGGLYTQWLRWVVPLVLLAVLASWLLDQVR